MPLRAVLFDMDDTLFAEREYVLSGFRAIAEWSARRLGCEAQQTLAELNGMFEAGVRRDTLDRWLSQRGLEPPAWIPEILQVYREHTPQITLREGTAEVLDAVRLSFALGLVSDGPLRMQQRKFQALQLARWFPNPVFSDAGGPTHWKPSPDPFWQALSRLAIPPDQSVYVGDNPHKDFLGARRAGMRSIRLRYADGLYAALEPQSPEMAADLEIRSIHDLPRTLHRLGDDGTESPSENPCSSWLERRVDGTPG